MPAQQYRNAHLSLRKQLRQAFYLEQIFEVYQSIDCNVKVIIIFTRSFMSDVNIGGDGLFQQPARRIADCGVCNHKLFQSFLNRILSVCHFPFINLFR
jgi:hypothetical protein